MTEWRTIPGYDGIEPMPVGTRWYQKGGYRERLANGMWEWHDNDGAEQLAEREAEEEVHEPRVECPVGGDCPPDCDRTHSGCVNIWGSDAEHAEAAERNAELRRRMHCVFCDGVFPDGCTCGDEPTEPALTGNELVGVRELLERFGLADVSSAGDSAGEVSDNPQSPSPAHPDSNPFELTDDEAQRLAQWLRAMIRSDRDHVDIVRGFARLLGVIRPGVTADAAGVSFVDWAVPAICTVLAAHFPQQSPSGYDCNPKDSVCPIWHDEQAWLEHVAPLIAERLERAARTEK